MTTLEQDGLEVLLERIPLSDTDALTAALDRSSLHRSRAGMRNVLQLEAVRSLALDPLLLNFAKAALGCQALPFRATYASSKVLQSKRRRVLHIEYCSRASFPGGLELPVAC
jgi:hypothetical protein